MILFCFVIAWAARGLVKQGAYDARTGWSRAWTSARRRTGRSFHKARRHPSRAIRWPARTAYGAARTGAGLFYAGRASVRGGRTVWGSLWTGAKDGAEIGRVKHAIYTAKREKRRAERRAAWDGEPYPRTQTPRTDEPVREPNQSWTVRLRWPEGVQKEPFDAAHPNGIAVWDGADLERRKAGLDGLVKSGELEGYEVEEVGPGVEPVKQNQGTSDEAPAVTGTPDVGAESGRDQMATVTPIREGDSMSAPTGEAAGLDSGLAIYQEWIKQLEEGPAGLEKLSSGLGSHGLSGDPVDAPTRAAELITAAKAEMEAGHAALQEHLAAAERLRALNGDEADSTEFYTKEA